MCKISDVGLLSVVPRPPPLLALCLVPCALSESDGVVRRLASSGVLDMEDAAWLRIPGPYVSGHTILSQLTFPARKRGLIYGDIESGEKHTPAAEGV